MILRILLFEKALPPFHAGIRRTDPEIIRPSAEWLHGPFVFVPSLFIPWPMLPETINYELIDGSSTIIEQ